MNLGCLHAMVVMMPPAVAPAAAEQTRVDGVGYVPGVLIIVIGDLPVTRSIQLE